MVRKREDREAMRKDIAEQIALNPSLSAVDVVNAFQPCKERKVLKPSAKSSDAIDAVKPRGPTGNCDGALQERVSSRRGILWEWSASVKRDQKEDRSPIQAHWVPATNAASRDCSSLAILPRLERELLSEKEIREQSQERAFPRSE